MGNEGLGIFLIVGCLALVLILMGAMPIWPDDEDTQ
jgi:hypothetical protein